jgi:hypothetical protein
MGKKSDDEITRHGRIIYHFPVSLMLMQMSKINNLTSLLVNLQQYYETTRQISERMEEVRLLEISKSNVRKI